MIPPTYNPRSRKFNERPIRRKEESFDELYEDMPSNRMPSGGVKSLENYRIIRGSPTGRKGSRVWSSTTDPSLLGSLTATSSISGNVRTITITSPGGGDSGGIATANRWFNWPGTTHRERIIERTNATTLKTRSTSSSYTTSTANCFITGGRWGRYHSKRFNIIFHHFGANLYYSNNNIASYTKCVRLGHDALPEAISRFKEVGDILYIGCGNKLFRLNLNDGNYLYYRINMRQPSTKITGENQEDDTYTEGYRYTYTLLRLSGQGDRDRNTTGVAIEWETPPVEDNDGNYGEIWRTAEIGAASTESVGTLTNQTDDTETTKYHQQPTHYGLYRTRNITGKADADNLNSPTIYVWVDDVPALKAMYGSQSTTTLTVTKGLFADEDTGCTIRYASGESGVITEVLSTTTATINTSQTVSATGVSIGNGTSSTRVCIQSTTTVTRTVGASFAATDVGKRLVWSDGSESVITAYTDGDTVTVSDSKTRPAEGCAVDATSRKYVDATPDSTLEDREIAWPLVNNLFSPVPAGNILEHGNGYFFHGVVGGKYVYYTVPALDRQYLAGYYHPYQYIPLDGALQKIKTYGDSVAFYTKSSITGGGLTSGYTRELEKIQSVITLIGQTYPISENIGLCHPSMAIDIGDTTYFYDMDMKWRRFDGDSLSGNIAENRIMTTLRGVQPIMCLHYDPVNDIVQWMNVGWS